MTLWHAFGEAVAFAGKAGAFLVAGILVLQPLLWLGHLVYGKATSGDSRSAKDAPVFYAWWVNKAYTVRGWGRVFFAPLRWLDRVYCPNEERDPYAGNPVATYFARQGVLEPGVWDNNARELARALHGLPYGQDHGRPVEVLEVRRELAG